MSAKKRLNRSLVLAVVVLAADMLFPCTKLLSQSFDTEEEIDLDSLEDEKVERPENEEEAFLPMKTAEIELERNAALMWVALLVLAPVSSLLLPVTRTGKRKHLEPKRHREKSADV
ncbi:MAG: hypothetical protein JXA30_18125 [Deltaproteobacteria bacterium]|nr:hypothetical protein [Deltaproteobacteria bacterium]